jgi:2-polyprenyl-3-methyl-5-hydroxy-6-metoxy-1,4-benzoquinol methylase
MPGQQEIYEQNLLQTCSETDSFTVDRYRQFATHLARGDVVLDVGCNTGRGGIVLAGSGLGLVVDGVEMLTERLKMIPSGIYRQLHQNLPDVVAQDGGRYDAVVLGEVIEHVPYGSLDDFVTDLLRAARSGGQVLLTTPNPHSLLSRLRHRRVLGGAHVSVHCPAALAELFLEHGAGKITTQGTGKTSRYLGRRFPLACYGSFLMRIETRRSA